MSAPISDDENSDYSKFAPKRLREQLPMPAARHLYPAPTVPSSSDVDQDRRTMSELAPWPEQVREPPPRRLSGLRLIGRIAVVSTFAALVALLTILAKPLWQSERIPLNAGSQTSQASKPSDRLTAINAPANTTPIPAAGIAAAPGAAPSASAQQAPPAQGSKRRSHRTRKNHGTPFEG